MSGFDFPKIEWWRENVLMETDSKRFFKRHYYEYYLQKYIMARMAGPTAICEIGVRWGYSAYSFLLAAPQASYLGLDIENGGCGGAKLNTFPYVGKLLGDNFPKARVDLRHINTSQIRSLSGYYDFVHVDGDHHEQNCYHDMEMALDACISGGVVLVDDYISIDGVKRAVNNFVRDNEKEIERWFLVPSLTGEFVMVKK